MPPVVTKHNYPQIHLKHLSLIESIVVDNCIANLYITTITEQWIRTGILRSMQGQCYLTINTIDKYKKSEISFVDMSGRNNYIAMIQTIS